MNFTPLKNQNMNQIFKQGLNYVQIFQKFVMGKLNTCTNIIFGPIPHFKTRKFYIIKNRLSKFYYIHMFFKLSTNPGKKNDKHVQIYRDYKAFFKIILALKLIFNKNYFRVNKNVNGMMMLCFVCIT